MTKHLYVIICLAILCFKNMESTDRKKREVSNSLCTQILNYAVDTAITKVIQQGLTNGTLSLPTVSKTLALEVQNPTLTVSSKLQRTCDVGVSNVNNIINASTCINSGNLNLGASLSIENFGSFSVPVSVAISGDFDIHAGLSIPLVATNNIEFVDLQIAPTSPGNVFTLTGALSFLNSYNISSVQQQLFSQASSELTSLIQGALDASVTLPVTKGNATGARAPVRVPSKYVCILLLFITIIFMFSM